MSPHHVQSQPLLTTAQTSLLFSCVSASSGRRGERVGWVAQGASFFSLHLKPAEGAIKLTFIQCLLNNGALSFAKLVVT